MIQDFIDMDTQQKIRYVSESSSGYSTMSPGAVPGGSTPMSNGGNLSPASSSNYSLSPAGSPATALQAEFSNLNLPSNSPQDQQQYMQQQQQASVMYNNTNGKFVNVHGSMATMSPSQFVSGASVLQPLPPNSVYSSTPVDSSTRSYNKTGAFVKSEYPAKLKIIEQPVEKFRFRYKSEMHGTHGSLNGANSKRSPKTFPEVELCDYSSPAIIRCSLFQTNLESPHSHQLVVRRDDTDVCDPHDLQVSKERGYFAQFQNMGIIHTAKKFILDELLKKKTNRLRFELGRDDLSTKQRQELHKETEKEAKDMNLNQVRLCFEAFKVESNNTWIRIAESVYTHPINNRKSAQTGELRICRLSIATGSVMGGEDLILLVEKVSKKNIKVRFYEEDEDQELIWEAFGRFRESDVHHQYAIVCQIPPYKDKDVDHSVEVFIELVRPSDDERSFPPVSFRYKPRDAVVSRKRRRTCSTATNSSGSGSSLSSFELPKTLQEQTATAAPLVSGMAQQSMAQHVAQSQPGFYGAAQPTISEEFKDFKEQELQKLMVSDIFRDMMNSSSEELSKYCPQNLSELDFGLGLEEMDIQTEMDDPAQKKDDRLETDGTCTAAASSSAIQDAHKKQLLLKPVRNLAKPEPTELKASVYLQRIFKIYEEHRAENQQLSESARAVAAKKITDAFNEHTEKNGGPDADTLIHDIITYNSPKLGIRLWHILAVFRLGELFNRAVNAHGETGLHCACLYDRAHFIRPLLGLGCDPNLQDHLGNTALHMAVKEQHFKCIDSFLNMTTGKRLDLSIRNDEGWTAFHLAVRQNQYDVVEKLLKYDKSAVLARNPRDGNNAVHMAVVQQSPELIKLLLDEQDIGELLSSHNTAGLTPLDLAKTMGSRSGKEILSFLIGLGKEVNSLISIKEEEISSSSTEDDEDTNEATIDEAQIEWTDVKEEELNDMIEEIEDDRVTSTSTQTLENILNNPLKFKKLVGLLDDADKWKTLAKRSKMQHLLCIWSNAEDMLGYVKKKASSIEYRVFAEALAEVDKDALRVLQAI